MKRLFESNPPRQKYRVSENSDSESNTSNRFSDNDIVKYWYTINLRVSTNDEFFNWHIDVNKFLDITRVLKDKQVKMVTVQLIKSVAFIWWDKIIIQRRR